MENKFKVSAAPHLHDKTTVSNVMWQVVIALVPALIAAVYFYGINALFLTIYGVVAAVLTEYLIQKWRKVPVTVSDGSAVLTGLLLTYNLHAGAPWWLPVVGSVFAIAIGKQVFGGLGNNPVNPALLARAFLVASWPTLTTSGWVAPKAGAMSGITCLEGLGTKASALITSATPLGVAKMLRDSDFVSGLASGEGAKVFNALFDSSTLQNLFWGNVGGVIGEVSAFALLLGAAWLIHKKIIEWRIPVSFILTVVALSFFFGGIKGLGQFSLLLPIFHILSGGLLLGAIFMATDYVTSPMTRTGRIYFGIGCGVLTVVIRLVGGYPEGVSYSILLMNLAVPLIDKWTMPKPFGGRKKK
jgi:electron transport complex protein RnfD